MSFFELYLWFTIVPGVRTVALVCAGVAVILMVLVLAVAVRHSDESKKYEKLWTKSLIVVVVSVFFVVLLPSREDAAIIVAGEFVTNIDKIEQLPAELAEALLHYLREKKGG